MKSLLWADDFALPVSRNFFFFDTMGKTVNEILGDDVIQGFVTGRYFYDINKRDR